jgi:hypothetical protein
VVAVHVRLCSGTEFVALLNLPYASFQASRGLVKPKQLLKALNDSSCKPPTENPCFSKPLIDPAAASLIVIQSDI